MTKHTPFKVLWTASPYKYYVGGHNVGSGSLVKGCYKLLSLVLAKGFTS